MAHDFRHLALYVNDLRRAEVFYREVFAMEVLFREVETPDGEWYTLRPDKGWEEANAAGVEIAMVALQRDDFTLAIFRGEPQQGTVVEIGITVMATKVIAHTIQGSHSCFVAKRVRTASGGTRLPGSGAGHAVSVISNDSPAKPQPLLWRLPSIQHPSVGGGGLQ